MAPKARAQELPKLGDADSPYHCPSLLLGFPCPAMPPYCVAPKPYTALASRPFNFGMQPQPSRVRLAISFATQPYGLAKARNKLLPYWAKLRRR